jgi:hypothetical protein
MGRAITGVVIVRAWDDPGNETTPRPAGRGVVVMGEDQARITWR